MRILFLLVLGLVLAACTATTESSISYADIPATGDVARGEALFNTSAIPPCAACHVAPFTASPSLEGFGEVAETRVDGMSAHEYAFYSIVQPEQYIVEGFGNAMYNKYSEDLSAQDIADLIAYLLAQ
jgi:cytochrome c553